jgi:hypothetical protein
MGRYACSIRGEDGVKTVGAAVWRIRPGAEGVSDIFECSKYRFHVVHASSNLQLGPGHAGGRQGRCAWIRQK